MSLALAGEGVSGCSVKAWMATPLFPVIQFQRLALHKLLLFTVIREFAAMVQAFAMV